MPALLLGLCGCLSAIAGGSAPADVGWRGPAVAVVQGRGLPAFSLVFTNGTKHSTSALWLTGGSPSLWNPVVEPKMAGDEARFHREQHIADRNGVRIVSAILSFVGYAATPEIHENGTLTANASGFLRRLLAQDSDSLLLARIRLDLKPPAVNGTRPGVVFMQSVLNSSHTASDALASPTKAWAARLGSRVASVMVAIDAMFPGRVVGAQILHGVTFEGNYPGAWSAASVEGRPAGLFDHMWPDYSPDAAADFCSSASRPAGRCVLPTAAERNRPTLGSTIITSDSPGGEASVAFNRFINVQMASGIAAVGDAIKRVSGGKAFVTTLYGGSLNGPAYATAGGSAAETELLRCSGIDGVGNPSIYSAASRSDLGTMQPQSPWDSPKVNGKLYVIEYDLRTWLDPTNTVAAYDYLSTEQQTADLLLHDFTSAAIRGHALYVLDAKATTFVNDTNGGNGTVAIWAAVQRAVKAASLFEAAPMGAMTGLAAEVAVFIDDISTAHWPLEISRNASGLRAGERSAGIAGWPDLMFGNVPETFASLPFPVRYHLLSDLLSTNFTAAETKLAVLLNPLRVGKQLAAAIKEKLQVNGKTVVYSVGVGVVDGDGKSSPDQGRSLTGLPLRLVEEGRSNLIRSTVFAAPGNGSAWPAEAAAAWAPLVGSAAGATFAASPAWYVDLTQPATVNGAKATVVLGHYAGASTLPALVKTEFDTHTAVFSANPALPTAAYQALAAAAGVHSYTEVSTATTRVEAGGNMLVVHHSLKPSARNSSGVAACEVLLPRRVAVRNAVDGSIVCNGCDRFTDCAIESETRVYLVSAPTE